MGTDPRYGGTLRYYGPGGMDHVDPACAYYAFSHQITRLFTRQLFSYRTTLDESALVPVPDVAAEVPTVAGGGLSPDGRRYRIRLRPGVLWDTDPPRPVTAADFVRGFKRMCNPIAGAGAITYYTSTIRGMAEFAEGYRRAFDGRSATAEELADYQNRHEISGLTAEGDDVLVIDLVRPANDMLNILAMMFASPAPVEYDAYVPDSPELIRNLRSLGPYRLTGYEAARSLTMERNPAWRQETDPVRHQYVERIEVRMARASDEAVRQEIASGAADLSWGAPVISPDRRVLDADRHLGYALNPYLVFNMRSPNQGGAVRDLNVRRAIAYAVDKAAMVRFLDEMNVGTVTVTAHTAIPYGNVGHREYDRYPTLGDRGDPRRARELLAEAGYAGGLTLKALYREDAPHDSIAKSYAEDLEAVGITVELVFAGSADEYYRLLQNPARAEAGEWDITAAAWTPDWFGNNGRAYVQPMFQSNFAAGTANYGDYRNPVVDRLISEALAEPDPARAEELWHQVDRQVLEDVAIVPILACEPTIPHMTSPRVRNAMPMPQIDRWLDAANIWLDGPD
ncbi:ABC transporter substrate-binding protein [Phytohabitans houttuyneae]|uniref:ABC transporter substrate-binding protein n=1 Tax=Phytohabitans houttuyneae TaxID=1076126 RepID=A0A6V8JVZ7_9ACTN|nr:ABC transporter substrate-binding protein [Phytohabitans houttuyneae]GFJ76813.1 ABC transporter substrate-binding protein [Phytohabitans houttuyneae]